MPESPPSQEGVEWRHQFFEALDLIDSEIDRRFNQPCMKEAAENFIGLCLCLSVSSASSERSFSALKRLKTWLRNVTQKRLTHLALMQVLLTILDRADILALIQKSINITPER